MPQETALGSMRGTIGVIVNPQSANGRTARTWKALKPLLEAALGQIQAWLTNAPGHAIELTRGAIRKGCKTLIAVGGDGTLHEVVNGFFEGEKTTGADAVLGFLPQGTACDFRHALAIPLEAKAAVEILRRGHTRQVDLMKVRFQSFDGTRGLRYSINITSFGMGGLVAARTNRSSKILGGRLSFLLTTGITTLTFPGNTVNLRFPGQEPRQLRITNVAVGNGQHHGGGMWVCPNAVIDDGQLDVTVIPFLSALEVFRNLPALYGGRLYEHPKVGFMRVARLEASSEEDTFIEVDGETVGKLPLEISVLPRAVSMLAPAVRS